ncbi:MAG TPA: hypothetical protein VFL04_01110 [Rectinemataceae bacterium]|nr:hypothetical protein [Rectinemataceae bacterium]
MARFTVDLDVPDALRLYLFVCGREEELQGPTAAFAERLRAFLYEHLSIEDMEHPKDCLARLTRDR